MDAKPIIIEFLPRRPIRRPEWSHKLMKTYWNKEAG